MTEGATFALQLDGQGGAFPCDDALSGDGIRWLHLNRGFDETHTWLRGESGLDPVTIDALLDSETRPHWAVHDGGILCTLRGVNLKPDSDPSDMISVRIWLESDRIITVHLYPILAAQSVQSALQAGKGPRDPAGVFALLTSQLIERMTPTLDGLVDQLDDYESRVADPDDTIPREEMSRVRRQVLTLKRYLAPQREALATLAEEKPAPLDDHDAMVLEETANRLMRHVENLELTRERATLVQEELANQVTQQLNERMYIITVIAALFLPLSFLTGLMGTNVGGIPFASNPAGFLIQGVILTAIGAATLLWLRRRGWL